MKSLTGRILTLLIAFSLASCAAQKYRSVPLAPARTAASLESRSLADPSLREFLVANSQPPPATWPLPQWNLADLTLAAFYYNPALRITRKRVFEAEAAIVTASARPNPHLSGDIGGETAPESPWVAGLGFSLPLEMAGKRAHRISAAERLADVAHWDLASTAWKTRAQVRAALGEYLAANRSLELLQGEERLRAEQVALFEQRLTVGMIPRPEVDAARIEYTRVRLGVRGASGRASQAQVSLAAAIGVPQTALNGVNIVWTEFDQPPTIASLPPKTIQEDAVLNRLDIRQALTEYSAAEAALQVEIAKQYPDLDLGPSYAFEEGAHLFTLALGLTLPIFNRNQGPIAEAKARREVVAEQFLATQGAGIAQSEQAMAKYTAALEELSEAQRLLQQSITQEQATQRALEAGASDRVALNGAQLQTAITREAQFDALYKAQQALGDLENAVQRPLLPGDIQPLSPQSSVLRPTEGEPR